jgi:N-acetylneuraminate synthase
MSVLIIAEAGVNHNGDIGMALRLVEEAARAGADCVKFQTFKAERLAAAHAPMAAYQRRNLESAGSQLEMLKRLELSREDHVRLQERCRQLGIRFLSSPFDIESASFLIEGLGLDTIKLGSGELTNGPLLLHVARAGVKILLSTGMSTLDEVKEALGVIAFALLSANDPAPPSRAAFAAAFEDERARSALQAKVTLLHCTTEYPAPPADANLHAIETLVRAFGLETGFSDHSEGVDIATAAVALGASVIEKHFTLDRQLPGPDHKASLEPSELAELVQAVRAIEAALGNGIKVPAPSELANRSVARKSLAALRPIAKGETFDTANLGVLRPGTGLSPMLYWERLGSKAERDYSPGDLIT